MREEDAPPVAEVLVEVDFPFRGIGREVRCLVAELERHKSSSLLLLLVVQYYALACVRPAVSLLFEVMDARTRSIEKNAVKFARPHQG
jgi:hypothetical protein